MARLRRLLLVAALVAVAAGAASGRARAASCPPAAGLSLVQSQHFTVAYDPDSTNADFATQSEAQDVAGYAEQAYGAMTALGFAAPAVDGSGKTELTISDLSTENVAAVICSGNALFAVSEIGAADEAFQVGGVVFQLIMEQTWLPTNDSDEWLYEAASSWASWKALGYPGSATADLGPTAVSLDCYSPDACVAADGYASRGESRWPFFELLAQRYGVTFVNTVLADAATAGSALGGLEAALATKNESLSDFFNDYATREMTGGWNIPTLDAATFPDVAKPAAAFTVGTQSGSLGSQAVTVSHLASRYVSFQRGDGVGGAPCFAATLSITVTMPSNVPARPYFFFPGSGTTALSVSGNTATGNIPWDTCTWTQLGMLSLANPTTNVDAAWFTVSAKLSVDTSTPASPSSSPAQVPTGGTSVIAVPTSAVAPTIDVFGPEVLRVSSADRLLRLIVQSSGPGTLDASLGSTALGTASLRAGNNDVRFPVPKSLLAALRRSAAASNILTLTPAASTGTSIGTAVTRLVSIQPAAKPKHRSKR